MTLFLAGIVGYLANRRVVLERQVATRTAELGRANEALRDASQAKDRFFAHMSHEIRTPLHSVIGMSGLLTSTALSEEQQEYAETIRVSGESLLSVVNEILDFSKIEADKLELESQPFNLRHCLEDAIDVVAALAAKKNLELFCRIEERLPTALLGDVTRLRQILVNLLSNAIKFTDKGEVEISVSGETRDSRQALLCFCVRDTGLGISPEAKSKLFQSFSQCDASTTRRYGGTGLGLVISKRLCELMGGAMEVDSLGVPGYGTTFRFSILVECNPEVQTPDVPTDVVVAGKRVLIAASNKTCREILAQQSQTLGLHPVTVSTGREALDVLGRVDLFGHMETFDLAILDAI